MRPATVILSNSPQSLLLQSVRLLICLLCMNLAQPFAALAQTNKPAPLPPAAQEAFDKGIMAAREQGYLVAIRYLQEARKLAPQAPQIFRSLGAVEAKIQGRELRAMAWYGAYLAAMPNAPDAAEVRKEIVRLEVKSQISIFGLIKSAQDATNHIRYKANSLENVAKLWAKAGDITLAYKTADLIPGTYRDRVLQTIVEAQAETGDIAGALKTAEAIQHPQYKSSALSATAKAQINAGDIVAAKKTWASAVKTTDLIDGIEYYRSTARAAIAYTQAASGDIAGALKTTDLIREADRKGEAQKEIAKVQAEAGDITGALKTADFIQNSTWMQLAQQAIIDAQLRAGDIVGTQKTADFIQNTSVKSYAQVFIASALWDSATAKAKSGDFEGALKTADLIQDAGRKGWAQEQVAIFQAQAGDMTGAQKTTDLIQDVEWKKIAQRKIAEAQVKTVIIKEPIPTYPSMPASGHPSVITASDWIAKLDAAKDNNCPLNSEPFLDLAGYLKSLPTSDNPEKVFESLHKTIEKIVKAQNVIQKMLKQKDKK